MFMKRVARFISFILAQETGVYVLRKLRSVHRTSRWGGDHKRQVFSELYMDCQIQSPV